MWSLPECGIWAVSFQETQQCRKEQSEQEDMDVNVELPEYGIWIVLFFLS